MSGSSENENDREAACRNQQQLSLLTHIADQRRRHQRIWLHWSPTGWLVI